MIRAMRKLLLACDSSSLCRDPFFVEYLEYVKGMVCYSTGLVSSN